MTDLQAQSLGSLNDTSSSRDLCPRAQVRDDGISAGMGAGTSRIRIPSVFLLSNILLS